MDLRVYHLTALREDVSNSEVSEKLNLTKSYMLGL